MSEAKERPRRLGIALGGGAALGAAHIGVLRAFEEVCIRFDGLTGTSIGSFIAALHAFEMDTSQIYQVLNELNWLHVTNLNPSRLGLLSNDKLGDIVRECLGEVTFEEAPLALAFVTADICTGEKVVLNSGPVAQAVMASCAIPGIFSPVELDERLLVDGGLVENVPVNTLRTTGVDITIGVDLAEKTVMTPPASIIDIVINMTNILLANARSSELDQADYTIAPDTSTFSMVQTDQVADLAKIGYEAAAPIVTKLKRDGHARS